MNGIAHKALKAGSIQLFMGADKLGAHILPKHYYSPVADHAWLSRNKRLWCRRVDMTGLDWNLERQMDWLIEQAAPYYSEVRGLRSYTEAAQSGYGLGYGPIEFQVLHCVCRALKPRRVVEIGCGVSTICMLNALRGYRSTIFCVEPFPRPDFPRSENLQPIQSRAQELPLTFFDRLESGDILFIDSSHSVKTGSDVVYLYLEVLPRLKSGVVVHIHDIFLPYVYPRNVLRHYFDWQETTLLLALLKGNATLRVLCCLASLHYDAPEKLAAILTDYSPQQNVENGLGPIEATGHFPSSIWLQVTG